MKQSTARAAAVAALAVTCVIATQGLANAAKKASPPKASLEISDIRLYTQPANPVCGEPVNLIAEIHTTKPGKVDFTLLRRVGRSEKASLTIDGVGDELVERWSKEFVYNSPVKREYMVVVDSQEFSTEWFPVDVTCEARIPGLSHTAQN